MFELKNHQLQAIRIEVAISICLSFPQLYPKLKSKTPVWISPKERVAADMLREMLRKEPSIKHILDFHYKREVKA